MQPDTNRKKIFKQIHINLVDTDKMNIFTEKYKLLIVKQNKREKQYY